MSITSNTRRALLAAALALAGVVVGQAPASAEVTDPGTSNGDVTPTVIAGNPDCEDLGYGLELKVDPPDSGTYSDGTLTVTATFSDSGHLLAWSSNLGLDAVFVKGGNEGGNLYVYNPEATADSGLMTPYGEAQISHVSFCYDLELEVSKTATTTFTRDYEWDIEKDVDTAVLNMFDGESGVVTWEIDVFKTGFVDSLWRVTGEITITNPAPVAARITGVTDVISGGFNATVNCPVTFPHDLAAGGELVCTYSRSLPDGMARTNTATVTTAPIPNVGLVGGGVGTHPVAFGAPTTEIDATVDVTDTNGEEFFDLDGSVPVTYPETFECDSGEGGDDDEGVHVNTATITQNGASDDATTTVNCYGLTVTKTANTTADRAFDWTIDKSSSDAGGVVLMPGQTYQLSFDVDITAVGTLENFAAGGSITITNPAPISVSIASVIDNISGIVPAVPVDCGVTFPHELAANDNAAGGADTLVCTYLTDLPDGTDRLNTARVTTEFGVNYFGYAVVDFDDAEVTPLARCVSLDDPQYEALAQLFDLLDGVDDGQYCVDGTNSATLHLEYQIPFMSEECVVTTFTNRVDLSTGQFDTVTIPIDVPCDTGCTLTIGYWKTHSEFGPAPEDADWYAIGDVDGDLTSEGPNETFFLSGKTWYEVFWTAPAGNVYYNLAHQYMGATLNIVNGASTTPAVLAAIASAEAKLSTTTPTQAAALKGAARNAWVAAAGTLAAYNQGDIGPGHCSENTAS